MNTIVTLHPTSLEYKHQTLWLFGAVVLTLLIASTVGFVLKRYAEFLHPADKFALPQPNFSELVFKCFLVPIERGPCF